MAVDANTGKEVWRTAVGDIKIGETTTMAPVVVRNMVYAGISGGELGVRGRLIAMDVKSGKILWRAWNSGSDADALIGPNFKPFYAKDQGKDLGLEYVDARPVEARWRSGLGLDFIRPGTEPDLLRHGKSRRLESGYAARRQQVVHHHLGARPGKRPGEMGVPGGRARRLGL